MIDSNGVRRLIESAGTRDECLDQLRGVLAAGGVRESIGHASAQDAFTTFSLREKRVAAGGVQTWGISGTVAALAALAALDPDAGVYLFHFMTDDRLFTVFVAEADNSIVGCLGLKTSGAKKPPGWVLG